MQETVNGSAENIPARLASPLSRIRAEIPSLSAVAVAAVSAVLLILSFPDFNLWPLAWFALVPLLTLIAQRPSLVRSFLLGWITGTLFFYGSCYWLTFSIINYGGINPVLAYLLLIPGAIVLGLFHALFALFVSVAIRFFSWKGLAVAPLLWPVLEWARLALTGQLWNALGYSQAFQTSLIQSAKWGGVYLVSFLIVVINCAIALALFERRRLALVSAASIILSVVVFVLYAAEKFQRIEVDPFVNPEDTVRVLALQPNVPMTLVKTDEEMRRLTERHIRLSEELLQQPWNEHGARLLVWPESPMNFEYASDTDFQALVTTLAREHKTAVLFNSQEPAPNKGIYNSAMLIDEHGKLFGQYDKIRLLPFGEYVPLPRWLPGASLITGIVGDFTPGANYTLFRVGNLRAGVFICIESAYPSIAQEFSRAGADVLINISNDGYLGRTAVLKQHLANAVFRAVENRRSLVRVTNTGITAYIDERGHIYEPTAPFEEATRAWTVAKHDSATTAYTRYGDLFVLISAILWAVVTLKGLASRRLRVQE